MAYEKKVIIGLGHDRKALVWDKSGERFYETGTDHGVLYPQKSDGTYNKGVAWNGLTGVTDSPGGAEVTDMWADNIKYASIRSAETSGGTIEAYTYPDEFAECDGSKEVAPGVTIGQQERRAFGFSYRSKIGNDTGSEEDDGYKIHIYYGCTASPSEKAYTTINDSPEAITFSWEFETTPVNVKSGNPTAHLVINTLKIKDKSKLKKFEEIIYGKDGVSDPRLPLPDEIVEIFKDDNPAISFEIEEIPTGTSLLKGEKKVEDLQENIVIGADSISGTSKYVTDFTDFSDVLDEQSGNYLALKFASTGEDKGDIYVEVIGDSGPHSPEKKLDEDGIAIFRIKEKSNKIKVRMAGSSGKDETTIYSLENLTLGVGD